MDLRAQLFSDFKDAMKSKDTLRKNAIQSVRTAALQIEKDQKIELTNDDFIAVVATQVKKCKSSLPEFEKSGREDLINELKSEIEILMTYLPEQLSEEEVRQVVEKTIGDLNATSMKDMGKVMGQLTKELSGKADTKLVSQLVRSNLNS